MRKIILTETKRSWTRYLFAFLCTFVLGNTIANQVNAQIADNDYIVALEVTDLSWNYPCADPEVSIDPFDVCGPFQSEGPGDFGFIVGGQVYGLPEDGGGFLGNSGSYVTDYNLGQPLDDVIGFQVVNSGDALTAAAFSTFFQAFENDCGDLMTFDTGVIDCGTNPDDSFVDVLLTVDWYNQIPAAAIDANGQPIPGVYPIAFGPFDGLDGSSYSLTTSVTILAVDTPSPADCGTTFAFEGYECNNDQTDEDNATAFAILSLTQDAAQVNGDFEIVESVGATFPFGTNLVPNGGNLFVQVVEDEPWFVEFANADGCTLIFSDVLDLPDFDILGLGGNYCLSDPPNIIWENSIYESGNPMPGLPPAAVPGTFTGLGIKNVVVWNGTTYYTDPFDFDLDNDGADDITEADMDGVGVFDPFDAGPGQHLISYIINNYGGIIGDAAYEDCYVAEDQIVNVYPNFYPEFTMPTTICVGSAPIDLDDPNATDYINQFDALATQFDPEDIIVEADDYISFAGIGVTNDLDGTGGATFNPAAAGVGVHSVELSVGYPSCVQTYVVTIEVVETVDATINNRTICASPSEAFDLTGLFGATTTQGGSFSLVSATPADDVSVAGDVVFYNADLDNFPVTVVVEYEVGDAAANGNCYATAQATLTILDEANDVFFDMPDHVCVDASLDLNTFLSGEDVASNGVFFFPVNGGNVAGDDITNGTLTLANNGGDRLVTVRWFQDNGTCETVVEQTFEVVDPANPDPTLTLPGQVCEFDAAFFLISPDNASPAGGTWTINGVESLDGFFNPAVLGAGTHDITYCFTIPAPEFCEECATGTIEVVEGPDPEFCLATAYTAQGLVGDQILVTADECANEVCSTADDCYLLVPTTTVPELLPTWDGLSGSDSAPGGSAVPATLTATVTIPANALAAHTYFDDLAFEYDYAPLPLGTSQGDHDSYTIDGPGGVTLLSVADQTAPDGTVGAGGDNHFDVQTLVVVEGGSLTTDAAAAYGAAAAAAGFDGTATEYFFSLFEECTDISFVYTLITNAAESQINLTLVQDTRAVDTKGEFAVTLHETGTDVTDWAITFDSAPLDENGALNGTYGYYSFCTVNEELGIDLAAYDEFTITFTTSDCDATNDGGMLCENSHSETIIVLETLDATLTAMSAPHCAADGNLDLEMLYEEGVTTQGGTFAVDNGSLDGNYLVVADIDFAGATSANITVTYTVGEGTTCDPEAQTMMVTVYSAGAAGFDFPETVCAGATYTLTPNAGAVGDLTGTTLPVTIDGDQVTIDADASGLYTIVHTLTDTGCSYEQEVLVLDANDLTAEDGIVCSNATVDLTQYVSSQGGTFSGSDGIQGALFFPNTAGLVSPVTITYTIDGACGGTATFNLTIVDSANAQFDLPGAICPGQTIDLADYFVPGTTAGGTFTASAGTIDGTSYTASEEDNSTATITYTVGDGACEATYSQIVTVSSAATAGSVGTAFVCQSEDDYSIDLTEYIDDGLSVDGSVNNGGYFSLGEIRPFITEIEYDASNDQEFVEVIAAEGTDLSDYALYFYERTDIADMASAGNSNIDGGVNGGKSSGRVYGVIPLQGIVGTTQDDPNVGNVVAAQDYTYFDPYTGSTEGVDIIAEGAGGLMMASSGISYGAIAFDPTWDIKAGAAGIALVNVAQAEAMNGGPLDLDQLDYNHNDAVLQFIGYGTDAENTNLGIFTSCDGPAGGMVSIDINVVDQDGAARSLQFTNGCWVVPNIDDSVLDYQDGGDYDNDNFDANAVGQDSGHDGNAGVINWGMTEAGADEFYYNYISPDGDILDLDRLCWSLFAVNQTQGDPFEDNGLEELGVDNEGPAGEDNDDEGLVKFNCTNPTYTVPFGYQTVNACGASVPSPFNLVVLMDIEEDWHAPKEQVCSTEAPFSLTDLISDEVHYIQPYHYEGEFEVSHTETFEENVRPPAITEIHYTWYNEGSEASDDHCILYNYVDDNNTPFNNTDDNYETAWICEGVEISAPIGTDLSCYQLVVYSNVVDADSSSCSNALANDVAWIDADGNLVEQDATNDIYIDLYGTMDADNTTPAIPEGHLMWVPTWQYYEWETAGEIDGYPFYDGINPAQQDNEGWYAVSNQPATTGLYVDVDDSGDYDPDVDFGPLDPTTFPWERADATPNGANSSHWFPILNLPDTIGGIGFINTCSGEKIDFLSWGGKLCVESEEDFSEAGPFEQLSSTAIDTTQNSLLGDLRSIQLVSCAELPGFPMDCEACNDNGTVWALVYNGGNVAVPACDYDFGGNDEVEDYSNSIGSYNPYMASDYFYPSTDAFEIDLTSLLANNTDGLTAAGYNFTGILPNNAIITEHVVEVQIGTGNSNDFQVYTFEINADNCGDNWDESDETSLNCGADNYCIVGEYVDAGLSADDNNGGDEDNGNNGTYDETFVDGNGENAPDNDCYLGECTSEVKTTYNVSNLTAYIYGGEVTENDPSPACGTAASDTCQLLIHDPSTYTVSMTVKVSYMQCVPTGNFHTSLDTQTPAPIFGNNLNDGPITMNTDDWDNPWWQMDVSDLGDMDIDVTYDVTNYHPIEADDATDDLACLDDDNDNVRTQEMEIINGGAGIDTSGIPSDVCAGANVALPGGAMWTGTGVSNGNFSMGMAGTYTLSYTTGGSCAASGSVDITVTPSDDLDTSGIPASIDCGGSVSLPAGATWSGNGVANGEFSSSTAGSYTLSYTTTGACPSSGTVSITVNAGDSLDTSGIPSTVDCGQVVSLPSGATWSGNGVNGAEFSANAGGSYTLNYTTTGACPTSGTVSITVSAGDSLDTSGIPSTVDCGQVVSLPSGATWSGNGVDGTTFSANAGGFYTINYTTGGACAASGSVNITVNAPADFDTSSIPATACPGDVIALPAGATWSGAGVSGLTFTAGAAGNAVISYTTDGACSQSGSVTIVVQAGAAAPTGIPSSVCSLMPISLPPGYTWSGPGVSGPLFNPTSGGVYTLNYTGSGACGGSGSVVIEVLEPIAVNNNAAPSDDPAFYTVTLDITGGDNNYTVNGTPVAGVTYTADVPCGMSYTYIVGSGSGCQDVTVTGAGLECVQSCTAEAGTLSVNLPGSGELFCTTVGVQMSTSGDNSDASTIYALSDPNTGDVLYLDQGGFFTAVPGGSYNAWVVNTCGDLGAIPSNAGAIASEAASNDGLDVDGPILIQVAPALTLDLIAFCDDNAGGYLIQVEVDGGAPAITGFGSYSLNFPFYSGTLTGTPPLTAVISDVGGMPFPGGVTIAVSVDSDGSLCEVTETVVVPSEACGIDGEMDDELTLADTPITFDVTSNDDGMDIQITGFTQPQNGTVTLNNDGTFTYVPDASFYGEDQFVYEITDAIGQSITVPVIVYVQEPDNTGLEDLAVADYVDCSNAFLTGEYTLIVTINGGVAPYNVSGSYNDVLNTEGSIEALIADGNPYFIEVTDAAGTTIIVQNTEVACTKVAVELLSFDGAVEADGDLLKWVSASEVNNSHYILEHSTNGTDYSTINVTEGAGTTSTVSNYSFLNKDAAAGINYYRLFAVDFDGTTVYHGTVTLVRGEAGLGFVNIFPVPATEVVNVAYTSVKTTVVSFEIYNVAGKLIETATVDANQGANQTSFNVSTYPVGTYFISVNDGDNVSTTRFVVE